MNQELENKIRSLFDEFVQHLAQGDTLEPVKFDTDSFRRFVSSRGVGVTSATVVALLTRWRCTKSFVQLDGQNHTIWTYRVVARG